MRADGTVEQEPDPLPCGGISSARSEGFTRLRSPMHAIAIPSTSGVSPRCARIGFAQVSVSHEVAADQASLARRHQRG